MSFSIKNEVCFVHVSTSLDCFSLFLFFLLVNDKVKFAVQTQKSWSKNNEGNKNLEGRPGACCVCVWLVVCGCVGGGWVVDDQLSREEKAEAWKVLKPCHALSVQELVNGGTVPGARARDQILIFLSPLHLAH